MTTNIILTLTWALATNSVLVGKVRHVDVPVNPTDSGSVLAVMRYDRVTLTYRHDLSSNLVASFGLMGTTQSVLIQSVPVRSWTTEENTLESPHLMLNSTLTPAVGGTGATFKRFAIFTNDTAKELSPDTMTIGTGVDVKGFPVWVQSSGEGETNTLDQLEDDGPIDIIRPSNGIWTNHAQSVTNP